MKTQNYLVTFLTLTSMLIHTGCSTMGKSVGLGGAIGAGTGAAIGGIATKDGKYRTRNVIIGAAVGGIAGSVAGAALHENTEREKENAYLKGRESARASQTKAVPNLQEPKVEAVWVDSKVVGNRYIEGHFEYVIKEPTRWEAP